jgi:CRAL/TRIO domain
MFFGGLSRTNGAERQNWHCHWHCHWHYLGSYWSLFFGCISHQHHIPGTVLTVGAPLLLYLLECRSHTSEKKRVTSKLLDHSSTASTMTKPTTVPEDHHQQHCRSSPTAGGEPDVYGQVHPDETEASIASALAAFDEESNFHGAALEARQRCPKLVLTREFQLAFLRAEVFDVAAAVKRYNKYWTQRVEMFGPDRAFGPLTIEADEEDALMAGVLELLPLRHSTGRAILVFRPGNHNPALYTREAMGRACWHVFHGALHDNEETQKKGVIILDDLSGFQMTQFDRKFVKMMMKSVQGSMPIRLSCVHICHPPSFLQLVLPFVMAFMHERVKKRLKFHFGRTTDKLMEDLSKYRLSESHLPTSLGGTASANTAKWIETRKHCTGF